MGEKSNYCDEDQQPQLGRAPDRSTVLFPGECITIRSISSFPDGTPVTVEPRIDSKTFKKYQWPEPAVTKVVANEIVIPNKTVDIIPVRKNEHVCQIRSMVAVENPSAEVSLAFNNKTSKHTSVVEYKLQEIVVDPNGQLEEGWRLKFKELHELKKLAFANKIGRYNDHSGKVRARVNIGCARPPTRKVNIPNYCPKSMHELQDKFDSLELEGVFARPEDVGVVVEHVSPSFLVKKGSGGYRLVTAFSSIGEYCKTLPTVMPTVESTLRVISGWKFLIKTDLRDSFYQIPLDQESRKWCATPTPFRGLRVYLVAAQGMPGSSETLEELMSTILGHLIQAGVVAKIADDLYVGGQNISELFTSWSEVLDIMIENGLILKTIKTFICPTTTQILGWDWSNGTISASVHKISPLISCEEPKTVTALRSFVGAYKVFNRLIKGCARFVSDLDAATAGKQKSDKISWNESLSATFKEAKSALSKASRITLPRIQDQLTIVHDGSQVGIGSILYLKRINDIYLGGFFSAKLKSHQAKWLPCEIEALSIATSVNHFGPYIRQSTQRTQILTDNKPCVQAWSKMLRGQFSSSSRVVSFMSVLSEYNVELQHISGSVNLPSDYQSRNPPDCLNSSCQICKFVAESDDVVVKMVTVEDILSGRTKVPYANKQTWMLLQKECPDLRRVHSYLRNGVRPTAKNNRMTDVKRYIQKVKISNEGILVVAHCEPFLPKKDLIVVPQAVLKGLLTSLHISLNHPTVGQLTKVFNRDYFALRSAPAVKLVWENCSTCQSLKKIPNELHTQTSVDYPLSPASSVAADVIRRYKQKILFMRDTFSSFTITKIIPNEDHVTLKTNLVVMISSIRSNLASEVIVRVDNAPGFRALKGDNDLLKLGITIDLGRVKNKNKNPVADKGILELTSELLRYSPEGGSVSESDLAIVTNILNSRIRNRGLSAWEILFQRDTETAKQLDFIDNDLAIEQSNIRQDNQASSAKSKAKGGKPSVPASGVQVGSLVYIKEEGDKTRARDRYMVTKLDGNMCTVMKLHKSKFQKKEYEVKLTEVFPVVSTVQLSDNCEWGFESSDDDLDVCAQGTLVAHDEVPTTHVADSIPLSSDGQQHELIAVSDDPVTVPDVISDDTEEIVLQQDSQNDTQEVEVNNVASSSRPRRETRKPAYLDAYVC